MIYDGQQIDSPIRECAHNIGQGLNGGEKIDSPFRECAHNIGPGLNGGEWIDSPFIESAHDIGQGFYVKNRQTHPLENVHDIGPGLNGGVDEAAIYPGAHTVFLNTKLFI